MFTQPAASPTSTGPGNLAVSPVTTTPASSTPPSRSSRLRGLTYLRNYTQTHILSREHSSHNAHGPAASTPEPASSTPSPPTAQTNPWFSALRNDPSAAPAPDNSNNPSSSARTNRFSQLVPALAPPLGLSTSSSKERVIPGTATGTQPADSPPAPVLISADAAALAGGTPETLPSTDNMTRARSATAGDTIARHEGGSGSLDSLPSIRFSTFYDPRATRPSLKFTPISRTLPTGKEVIRVGRYSERDNQPNVPANAPSAAPVGFKSKVVSRRHCEFWYEDGKWYIKDVKSSSGTFLNHIRLSPPGTESKPYPVNDGDIVQLGIDFKGGEEMIFRCVKMRLELNRGWQNKLNTFNIAPCQCLFVAPCSHTWHYKCIRSLLTSPSYPIFICPNCRAGADLEAEVEDPEEWEQLDSDEGVAAQEGALLQPPVAEADKDSSSPSAPRRSRESARSARLLAAQQQQQQQQQQHTMPTEPADIDMLIDTSPPQKESPPQVDGAVTLADATVLSHTLSDPMPIPSPSQRVAADSRRTARTPSPPGAPVTNGHEGPITPRNDAGPWVFDGSGVRLSSEGARPAAATLSQGGAGTTSRTSLEAAVQTAGERLSDGQ
ncbi:hypothetical protein C7999DRAFT_10234 [Corynascus novoguineensis]|uniref:FHA domain-containing protein n=1 Tax=Corynascus novoguineensis TaxID=1126955 RepID=A0AAN7HJ54_9PEZI|nr:hypothetical protein C7999DRAFT_10234 [Corynascus novoguineensis]